MSFKAGSLHFYIVGDGFYSTLETRDDLQLMLAEMQGNELSLYVGYLPCPMERGMAERIAYLPR